jgi:hypothetical protein
LTVLKHADDKQPEIDALTALQARHDLDPSTHKRIEEEIWRVRAGMLGERDAAYEIDFEFASRKSYVVIHDLRLEFGGRVAQIDHLLLNRVLDAWVCETKSFKEGVRINDHGEWSRYGGGRAHGMASPIAQNRRHAAVLKDVFDKGGIRLPRRVVTLKPSLVPVILVSNNAKIDRPKSKRAAAAIDGIETVFKVEQLARKVDERFDEHNAVRFLAKVVSRETIEDIGRQLVALHKPATWDWAARFGIPQLTEHPTSEAPVAAIEMSAAPSRPSAGTCFSCGAAVSPKVAAYSLEHQDEFGGEVLCFDCQRAVRREARRAKAT